MIFSISFGLAPAAGSSRISKAGFKANPLAISTNRCSPYGKSDAFSWALSSKPTIRSRS